MSGERNWTRAGREQVAEQLLLVRPLNGPRVWDSPGLSGYLVCLVHLVDLVCFVYLVDLVHLVSFVQLKNQTDQTDQTNQTDRPNRPNEQDRLADFFSILLGFGFAVIQMPVLPVEPGMTKFVGKNVAPSGQG